ncbi:MAG: hypothetical protein Q8P41_02020 [Pseudomonadota bacterium]|nr:hypothetical protein [Pseudomonadota bacterium]
MHVSPMLEDAQALVGLEQAALLARIGASAHEVGYGAYGPTNDLEAVDARAPVNGIVFFDKGRVILVVLGPGDPEPEPTVVGAVHADALAAAHPQAVSLRSRSGKQFSHYVDAAAGIAWSAGEGRVTYMELFEPTDLDTYKRRFYKEPMFFYK